MSSTFDNYYKAAEEFNYMTDDAVKEYFCYKIQELRRAIGVTQAEFAERLGISRQALSLYEKGARVPDICILNRIIEVTGCSFDYLLGPQQSMVNRYATLAEETGLSDEACEHLFSACRSALSAMESCLTSKSFWKLLEYIGYAREGWTLTNQGEPGKSKYFRFMAQSFVEDILDEAEERAQRIWESRVSRDNPVFDDDPEETDEEPSSDPDDIYYSHSGHYTDIDFDMEIDKFKSDPYGELKNRILEIDNRLESLSMELKEHQAKEQKRKENSEREFAEIQRKRLKQIQEDKFENFKARLHRYGPYAEKQQSDD